MFLLRLIGVLLLVVLNGFFAAVEFFARGGAHVASAPIGRQGQRASQNCRSIY